MKSGQRIKYKDHYIEKTYGGYNGFIGDQYKIKFFNVSKSGGRGIVFKCDTLEEAKAYVDKMVRN